MFSALSLLKQWSETKVQVQNKQSAEWFAINLLNPETTAWAGFKPRALLFKSLNQVCWIRFKTEPGTLSYIPMRPQAPMAAFK